MNDELNPRDVASNPKDIVEELDVGMLEDFMKEHSTDENSEGDDDFSIDEFYDNEIDSEPKQSKKDSSVFETDSFGIDSDEIPELADFSQSTDTENQDDFTFDDDISVASANDISGTSSNSEDLNEFDQDNLDSFDDFDQSPEIDIKDNSSDQGDDFNSLDDDGDDFDSMDFDFDDDLEHDNNTTGENSTASTFDDIEHNHDDKSSVNEKSSVESDEFLEPESNGNDFDTYSETDSFPDEFDLKDEFDFSDTNSEKKPEDYSDLNFDDETDQISDTGFSLEKEDHNGFTEEEFLKEPRDDDMFEEENRDEDELLVELSSSVIPQKKNISTESPVQDDAKVKQRDKVGASKKQSPKTSTGVIPLILCGLTSSLASVGAMIGYQTFSNESERMSDDDIRLLIHGAVNKATKKLELNIQESSKVMETNTIGGIREEVEELQSQYEVLSTSISNNNTNIDKISKSNIALNDAIKDVSLKQIESEKTLFEISTKNSGNAAFDKSTALKAIFKLSKKIETLEASTKNKIFEIEKQITESDTENKQRLIETKEALIKQLGEVRDVAETAELKLKDLQFKNGGNAVQSALGLGSGVNIVKGQLPEIPYKGIIQDKAFLVVPVEGGGEKVLGFSVGQYLDGYGRITEINPDPRNTTILTESGYVNLIRKP